MFQYLLLLKGSVKRWLVQITLLLCLIACWRLCVLKIYL